ncbi:RNA recognition motif domain-containing protein [Psychromonas sp. Urea-02u-13]|uniref:RNA recognition motif domain-containing protein n=1 Tax=Psychromonas sp. Urea-02u-13 TaxID=2058326 RepID=UPI000C3330F3|nr:RNA-binding protein [Psychromonas sp. Urea-02u-13]PKG39422.1 RNA-binding protein [Psychromonas sp. Urea-02u-13]
MKSNTSILLSIAVAILGYIIIAVAGLALPVEVSFAIGAIATGLAIQFIKTGKSTSSTSSSAPEGDFATTTLYVGNLPYRANEMAIRTLFAEQGKVLSVRLMKDKHTGKRRGFGFVEMPEKDAEKAIIVLNEKEFQDRSLKVREANERAPRSEQQDAEI